MSDDTPVIPVTTPVTRCRSKPTSPCIFRHGLYQQVLLSARNLERLDAYNRVSGIASMVPSKRAMVYFITNWRDYDAGLTDRFMSPVGPRTYDVIVRHKVPILANILSAVGDTNDTYYEYPYVVLDRNTRALTVSCKTWMCEKCDCKYGRQSRTRKRAQVVARAAAATTTSTMGRPAKRQRTLDADDDDDDDSDTVTYTSE